MIRGCNIPDDLFYLVEKHVWASYDGEVVTVGLSDVAQHLAKTVVAVTPKSVGKRVAKGKSLATVESSKWVGPVPSPVSGEVVEVNDAVTESPTTLNSDPYGEGWIARVRPDDWEADSTDLATGAEGVDAYQRFLEQEGIVCEGG
ncbi:MAG: glycine cleavage system protein GcvH [Actinomycetota bacterium]|jgi:glycine cleavage system H protein|nr:glycine cleavage system protein GcvH [Actinomycetota bacterium]